MELQPIQITTTHYPIQIKAWKVSVGEIVKKDQVLGIYEYIETIEDDTFTRRAEMRVPIEGQVESLEPIDFISHSKQEPLGFIKEFCSHSVQLHGLCALCGKDLTIAHYTGSELHRATINLTHDSKGVKISHKEATRIEKMTAQRLLESKKLSLLLDLDQTVVHATVDQTVGTWLENPENPEFPSLKDVHHFMLDNHPPTYFIKLRPGTLQFLEALYDKFEMHIYTMGTRNYAHAVANVIDPDKKYFRDRILSRDDSGSFEFKSIKRLFPVDQSMVVAIDDRADVWHWSPNLIKVRPYNFFLGIGDINEPIKADGTVPTPEKQHVKKPVLNDNDHDLDFILQALFTLHRKFYEAVEERIEQPNVCRILPSIKMQVLLDVHIVFSGIIPIGHKPHTHELWIMATQFGAKCYMDPDENMTHLVAKKDGTAKVKMAQELEFVWIVKVEWLIDCVIQWKRVKEEPYLLDPRMKPQQAAILDENAWKTMDDEVDEVLNDSSDEDETGVKKEGDDSGDESWLLDIEQELENELKDIANEQEGPALRKRRHSEIE